MSTTNEISQFRDTLKDLREKMLKMLKMCEGRDFKQGDALEILNDSLINLIDIKSLNRQIQGEVESIKDFLNNEKEKVEEKNLQLQNNMYQKENIVSQINSCINFPTIEMNKIQMPSKYEVLEHYKEKSLHKAEEELKLMDYLECELEIRKKLNEKVNDSLKDKEESITKLKDFEKFYSDLPKYLENLENSTLKSQNYLNLNFNEKNKNLNLSGKLPPPLFILYNLLQCFSDDALEGEINIKGREAKVDEFYSKYSSFFDCYLNRNSNCDNVNEENDDGDNRQKEEGEHSEGEIEDEEAFEKKNANKKKKKKRKNFFNNESLNYGKAANAHNALTEDEVEFKKIVSKLANKDERLSKFPLYVEFTIKKIKSETNENEESLKLYPMSFNFYFIPVVNLISVEIVNSQINSNNKIINLVSSEENTISMNLNTSQILFNVFHPPSTLLSVIKDKIEAILGECCAEFGKTEKTFDFLQILTNNSLYNSRNLKDFCMLYFNNKNKKNKSLLNLSVDNSALENPLNSFELEPNQLNFFSNFFDNTSSINIDNFISRIKDRLNYLPLLLSQVDYLLKYFSLKEEILNEFRNEKKFQIVKEKAKITNVRRVSKFDFYSKQEEVFNSTNETVKFSSFFINESSEKIYEKSSNSKNLDVEAIYLCLEFERKNYKINAYVEVRYDFPNQAPRFILTMESSKGNGLNIPGELMEFVNKENNLEDFKAENCGFSNILREIENEVNEYCLEDVLRNEKLIGLVFSYQVRTIQMCIDLFADRDNSKYQAYFAANNITSKRKRPFLFNDVNSSFHN